MQASKAPRHVLLKPAGQFMAIGSIAYLRGSGAPAQILAITAQGTAHVLHNAQGESLPRRCSIVPVADLHALPLQARFPVYGRTPPKPRSYAPYWARP